MLGALCVLYESSRKTLEDSMVGAKQGIEEGWKKKKNRSFIISGESLGKLTLRSRLPNNKRNTLKKTGKITL